MTDHYKKMVDSMEEQRRERMASTEVIKQRLKAKQEMEDRIKKMFSPKPAEEKPKPKNDSN